MLEVENQDHESIVVDLVQDAPGTRPHPPCVRVTYQLGSLPGARVLGEPVDDAPHLLLDGLVEPPEFLPRLIAEDDLVGHPVRIRPSGKAGFSLDLFPWDERLACLDAGAGLPGCGRVSEILKEFRQVVQ